MRPRSCARESLASFAKFAGTTRSDSQMDITEARVIGPKESSACEVRLRRHVRIRLAAVPEAMLLHDPFKVT